MPRAVLGGTDAGCRRLGVVRLGISRAGTIAGTPSTPGPGRVPDRPPKARARCPPAVWFDDRSSGTAPPINRVQFVVFRHVLLDVATRYRRPQRTESAPRQAGPAPARLASTTELPR